MILIKQTPKKHRAVFEAEAFYRKVWYYNNPVILANHVYIMNKIRPGYIIDYGNDEDTMWIDVKKIKGTVASTFEHTDEFIKKIYNFCLNSIKETYPYAHYDWVLSNMIIDGDDIQLIDWDNVGIYEEEEVLKKLHSDLKSAFGDKFDPTSI